MSATFALLLAVLRAIFGSPLAPQPIVAAPLNRSARRRAADSYDVSIKEDTGITAPSLALMGLIGFLSFMTGGGKSTSDNTERTAMSEDVSNTVWYEEVVIRPAQNTTVLRKFTINWRRKASIEETVYQGAYRPWGIAPEGGKIIIRRYKKRPNAIWARRFINGYLNANPGATADDARQEIPGIHLGRIAADAKSIGTTMANLDVEKARFTAYSVHKGDQIVPWNAMDVRVFKQGAKTPKRLNTLGISSYLGLDMTSKAVTEYTPFDGQVLSVKAISLKEAKAMMLKAGISTKKVKTMVDGDFFIRPSVRDLMVDQAVAITEDCLDEAQKERDLAKIEQMRSIRTFYAGRVLLGNLSNTVTRGLVKGEIVVAADDDTLDADIVYVVENHKDEIGLSTDGRVRVTMCPKKQGKSIRTNRQTLNLFGEALFGKNLMLIKKAFKSQLNWDLASFAKGEMEPIISDDDDEMIEAQAHRVDALIAVWQKVRGSILGSRYLMAMQLGNVIDRKVGTEPKDAPTKRRMPVPYARSYTMRTTFSYLMAEGPERFANLAQVHMRQDEIHVTDIGAIFGDALVDDGAFEELGGADKDDTVDLHVRFAADDSAHFFVDAGDAIAVITRNPNGVVSNGTEMGVEHWVARLSVNTEGLFGIEFGNKIPEILLSELPLPTKAVDLPEDELVATPAPSLEGYNKAVLWTRFEDLALSDLGSLFGMYVNLMIAFASVKLPFPHYAPTETFADICQQTADLHDLQQIARIIEDLTKVLSDAVEEGLIDLDPWIAMSLHDPELAGTPGLQSDMVDTHNGMMLEWEALARGSMRDMVLRNGRSIVPSMWNVNRENLLRVDRESIADPERHIKPSIIAASQRCEDSIGAARSLSRVQREGANRLFLGWVNEIAGRIGKEQFLSMVANEFFWAMGQEELEDRGFYYGTRTNAVLLQALNGVEFEAGQLAGKVTINKVALPLPKGS